EPVGPGQGSAAVVALFGREAVEDLETRLAAGGDRQENDAAVERIGIDFQIATRLTSWVAGSEERTVGPNDPLRRERMPHELPFGMSAEGLGLRAPSAAMMPQGMAFGAAAASIDVKAAMAMSLPGGLDGGPSSLGGMGSYPSATPIHLPASPVKRKGTSRFLGWLFFLVLLALALWGLYTLLHR